MLSKKAIVEQAESKGVIKTSDFTDVYGVSRQYVSSLISQLVDEKKLIKLGSTRGAHYVTPTYLEEHGDDISSRYVRKLINTNLEEHTILHAIENDFISHKSLSENVKNIFAYGFSEMLNNAIEHSQSKKIHITVDVHGEELVFMVDDFGIGVFRNVMKKRKLENELEAIQDILKGKTTTMPQLHSGEGIFFTSKIADEFVLESYGYQLIINNTIDDVFVKKAAGHKQGTKVTFRIALDTRKHLNDVFKKYTDTDKEGEYGFDKTEIRIKLYAQGGVHISRSQARRVLSGLDAFKVIIMDYEDVPMVGQAFADEVYRVFQNAHPDIVIQNENMNEAVAFMITRAETEASKK